MGAEQGKWFECIFIIKFPVKVELLTVILTGSFYLCGLECMGGVVSFSLKYIICIVNIFGDLIINKARLVVNIEKTNTFLCYKII